MVMLNQFKLRIKYLVTILEFSNTLLVESILVKISEVNLSVYLVIASSKILRPKVCTPLTLQHLFQYPGQYSYLAQTNIASGVLEIGVEQIKNPTLTPNTVWIYTDTQSSGAIWSLRFADTSGWAMRGL
jgi:hypothetical protein